MLKRQLIPAMVELAAIHTDQGVRDKLLVRFARRAFAGRALGTAGRLVTLYGAVTSVVLGLSVYQVVNNFSQHYMGLARSDLGGEVPEFSTAASVRTPGQSLFNFSEYYLRSHGSLSQHRIIIALANQTTLASTGASWLVSVPIVSSMLSHPPVRTTFYSTSYGTRGPILILGSPIMQNSRPVGLLIAESSLSSLYSQKRQVALLSGFEALVALVFSVLSSYYLLRRVMKAVGAITEAAVEIYQGDLDTRLLDAGEQDEVGGLVVAFNQMIARISDILKAQQRLLADVSHQLRTPLTVMRGNLELLQISKDEPEEVITTAAVLLEEIDYMSSMIDKLLLLERSTSGGFLNVEPVDLRTFLYDLFGSAQMLGERNWTLGEIPDLVVLADGPKLRGAVLNLLENAVKASKVGTKIELNANIRNNVKGGRLAISVQDEGTGIPLELQERIFQRFERGDSSDGRGTGLGLAIVKAIVEAHHGVVELESNLGVGSKFTLVIPINYEDSSQFDSSGEYRVPEIESSNMESSNMERRVRSAHSGGRR